MKTTLFILLLAAITAHAQQSTLGEGDSYTKSGNLGWIEMKPGQPNPGDGFRFGETFCAGWLRSANTGWINLGTGNLTTMDATSNQDKDGFSDLAEYLSMTNPLSPSSFLKVTKVEPLAPAGTTTALTWTSTRTRLYRIETSTDLGQADDWGKSILYPDLFTADDAATTTRNTQNPFAEKRFFRIKPVIPLQP